MMDEVMYLVGGGYADSYTMYVESINGASLQDMLLNIEVAPAKPTVEIVKMTDGSEWDDLVDGRTTLPPEGPLIALLDNMVDAGVAELAVRLNVSADIRSSDVGEYMRTGVKQSEFVFDGYRVEVEQVLVGEVKTNLRFRIISDRDMEEMNMDNDDPLWRAYEICDGATGVQFHASSSGGTAVDENGKVYYYVEVFADGMGAHSDTLRVVPFEYVPDPDGEYRTVDGNSSIQYCDDEALVIELIP